MMPVSRTAAFGPSDRSLVASVLGALLFLGGLASGQSTFVNWETAHVHPLDETPDGTRLLAVNTADNRLAVFDLTGATPSLIAEIPVGLDPVSVRARSDVEAWVVNHVSDSISIVDLIAGSVVATIQTADEPADVVFAGIPERAYVSCSQVNEVHVYDPANTSAPVQVIDILGEDPRALAVSADRTEVYVAVFESGNGSTVLGGSRTFPWAFPPNAVSLAGPHGGVNPPPNSGSQYEPPIAPGNQPGDSWEDGGPPPVALIVKKNAAGQWIDDTGSDWSKWVSGTHAVFSGRPSGWDVPDRDLAIIDASTFQVRYARQLMNLCMALSVRPDGRVTVIGTEAHNEVRFEPNVQGRFLEVRLAEVDPSAPGTSTITDLNPHLDGSVPTLPQSERDKSLGDPRGIVWNASGSRGYVTGMGSNNVLVIDANGSRTSPPIEVGQGPTGLILDEARGQLYVLNKFDATLTVIDTNTEAPIAVIPFFDPTPLEIKAGRPHLYDTHETSGLGQIACASCHVDARLDRLAWDLGDPAGSKKSVDGQNLGMGFPELSDNFIDFHPMKGPMTTQTLQDIIGLEPLHWRGDRDGIEQFNGAFQSLQGDDEVLAAQEMADFKSFLASITYPPNPFRRLDNSLPLDLPLEGHFATGRFQSLPPFLKEGDPLPNGDAAAGMWLFRGGDGDRFLDDDKHFCVTCHTLPAGLGTDTTLQGLFMTPIPPGPNGELHHALVDNDGFTNAAMKIPQLRNLYERVGFRLTKTESIAGFGFFHDGTIDSIERVIAQPHFQPRNDFEVANIVAFILSLTGSELPTGDALTPLRPPGSPSKDSHAAVGHQLTLRDGSNLSPQEQARLTEMLAWAQSGKVGLVVKGLNNGLPRGFVLRDDGKFQSDRKGKSLTPTALVNAAQPGSELTFTIVPKGTEVRIGIDRDEDRHFDRDELDQGHDPADPEDFPNPHIELGR